MRFEATHNGTGSGGGPFGDDARTYYDPDLRALALAVNVEVPPGGRWQYNNFHPLLLGMILERVTGRTVSAYLSEKGMNGCRRVHTVALKAGDTCEL